MKIAVIEDEALTAKDLVKTIVQLEPGAEIVAVLASVAEGRSFLENAPEVDLIFSDIQLGDGLSFEIIETSPKRYPVIFCTAFDEYALQAFKSFGIDYLLKPFSRKSVEEALAKFKAMKLALGNTSPDLGALMDLLKNQGMKEQKGSLIIQQGDKIIPLSGSKIALFYIEDDYVFAHTFEGKKHILSQKLDALEKQFSPQFFRANRQILVNRAAVKDAAHHFNRKIQVNLQVPFPEPVMVGKLKVTAFLEWLAMG